MYPVGSYSVLPLSPEAQLAEENRLFWINSDPHFANNNDQALTEEEVDTIFASLFPRENKDNAKSVKELLDEYANDLLANWSRKRSSAFKTIRYGPRHNPG